MTPEMEARYQAALTALAQILWSDLVETENDAPSEEIVTDLPPNEEKSA